MGIRGRPSNASLSIVSNGVGASGPLIQRPQPPDGMSAREVAVWRETVEGKSVEWFGLEHYRMLVLYVAAVVESEKLADQIKKFKLDPNDSNVVWRYEKFVKLQQLQMKLIFIYARAMRLTHQSKHMASAGTKKNNLRQKASVGKKIWD